MLTYADGVHVDLHLYGEKSVVRSTSAFGKVFVPAEDRQILVDLMFGVDETFAEDSRFEQLICHKMVVVKDSPDDPVLEKRLHQMGQQWSWQWPVGGARRTFDKIYKACLRAHARRRIFVQDFGQTPCMPETTARRAMLLGPGHKKVLCIGDDDLLSIPLALLGHEVTVYDVDEHVVIPFLRSVAREWNLPIKVECRDLMAKQPRSLKGKFEALFTDPMSTRECFDLFLSRGLDCVKAGSPVFCCVHPLAIETFQEVQRDMDFAVEGMHRDFNHYYEEGFWENYYRSDMMALRKLRSTRSTMPLTEDAYCDILSGELSIKHHYCADFRAFEPKKFDRQHVENAIEVMKREGHLQVVVEHSHFEDNCLCYVAALKEGGYFGMSSYFGEQLVAMDIYPYNAARELAIRRIMRREVPQTFFKAIYRVARAYQPAIGPELPAEPAKKKQPAKKKPAKKKPAKRKPAKVAQKTARTKVATKSVPKKPTRKVAPKKAQKRSAKR